MPLAGRNANIYITALTATSSTDNAATLAADGLSVQIDSTARRHWEPDSTPSLFLNSTAVSSTAYTVNYVQGKFEFSSTQSTGTYTIDAAYLTASQVGSAREWQLNVEADMFEVSTFGSSGWKQFQPNLNGSNVTLSKYFTDSTFLDHMLVDGKFVVELYPNLAAGDRYEGFARVVSDQPGASVDNIVGESVNLTIDGQLYYTTSP